MKSSLARLVRYTAFKLAHVTIWKNTRDHQYELNRLKTLQKRAFQNLEDKHKLEIEQKEKSHTDSMRRLSDEYNTKFEKLKNSYFISNAKTVEANSIANDREIIHNFLEKEFHAVVAQLKHSNDHLMEKQSSFLQEIMRTRTEQKNIIKNFEDLLEDYKDRLFSIGKKKKRKLKDSDLQGLIEDSTKE